MIQVLLADDHVVVRQGLKVLLEREGFHVVAEASDGQQAVQLAKQFQPDVAVLDVAMPILNGVKSFASMPPSRARIGPKRRLTVRTPA